MGDLGSRPTGVDVCPFDRGGSCPEDQRTWLQAIGECVQQPDGHLGAMYMPPAGEGPAGWRFVAYFGDSWDTAGDGWRHVDLTGEDAISRRDEATIESIWRAAVVDSRADHLLNKAAPDGT